MRRLGMKPLAPVETPTVQNIMTWYRYISEPNADRVNKYIPDFGMRLFGKPHGIAFTDQSDDSWEIYCLRNNSTIDTLRCKYEASIDMSECLFIDTLSRFDTFHNLFFQHRVGEIDWGAVAHNFKGIAIVPYLWSRRLSGNNWYYGWDCSTFFVWDDSIIKSVRHVETRSLAELRQRAENMRANVDFG